jgi:dihydrofolate synthase/folylpolyglutamate synthase
MMHPPTEERYKETLDWIYSWVDFSMKRHVDDKHRFFKLDRMNKLMELLDYPQHKFPSAHVAGTKGKGSTASLIASVLQASGYKVGLYTSPHLEDFRERIVINGEMISEKRVIELADLMRPLTEIVPETTTFELTTAMAFLYFAQEEVDIAVLEVGLGGRLDATNVVDPLVSVITSISYDHTSVLGDTLAEIAAEKGGIIKPGRPVVIAPQKPEARETLLKIAKERGALTIEADQEYSFEGLKHNLRSQTFQIQSRHVVIQSPNISTNVPLKLTMPLLGAHQIENAATAVASLDVLRLYGFHITRKTLQAGFKHVHWPARFEILREKPPVVIDSAHNGDSMQRLVETVNEYFPDWPFILIFGASADKKMGDMLDAILPRCEMVITTQSLHPRAATPEELKAFVEKYSLPVIAISPVEEAIAQALFLAGESKGILVTGSIFIASAARIIWSQMQK